MYLDNHKNPIEYQGQGQVIFLCVVCMIQRLPRTVFSLEQGLNMLVI